MINKNSLGCGKGFKNINNKQIEVKENPDFICGIADGWGQEKLCKDCKIKLKEKWKEEDLKRKLKGGIK